MVYSLLAVLRSLIRVLLYALPLILWMGLGVLASTELGGYDRSWILLHRLLDWIAPGYYYSDNQILSMYQLTQATRKIAHVVVYAVLTGLLIRLAQRGRPQLRFRSVFFAVALSGASMGLEAYVRRYQSEGTRHVRAEQFFLEGFGVLSVVVGTFLYFQLKALERWLDTPPVDPEPGRDPEPEPTETVETVELPSTSENR